MFVASDDEISIRCDGTVGKLVVVPVCGNSAEKEGWGHTLCVVAMSDGEVEQSPEGLPPRELYDSGIYQESIAVVAAGSLEQLIESISNHITP